MLCYNLKYNYYNNKYVYIIITNIMNKQISIILLKRKHKLSYVSRLKFN